MVWTVDAGGAKAGDRAARFMPSGIIYRFGEFEVDDAQFELRFRGDAQVVAPRVLRALVHLLKNRQRAVSRDELLEVVWGGLVVSDAALSQTIMLARKATFDQSDPQDVIKTVRGLGFRFVATVTEIERRSESNLPRAAPSDQVQGSLLGRAPEQALLRSRLEFAERGRGSLVLLQGAPGIGKTSLVEALAAQATLRGVPVFWGRSWEDGGAPPFWPFIQVLRALQDHFGEPAMASWLDDSCRDLLRLVPELAPPAMRGVQPVDGTQLQAPQAKFRVFDAISRVLRRMAHALHREDARPPVAAPAVVIALDDLHAADDASVHLLRFLSADLRDTPLLVIGAFRDLEVTGQCALSSLIGGPLENTHRLSLAGLELPDTARLMQRLLQREVPEPAAAQLHALSNGNPFMVAELARHSQGELELSALGFLRVPERMAKAVRRRLQGLSETQRAVLDLAAVLGVEFPIEHLRLATARSNELLLRELEPALRSATLEPVAGTAGSRLRFVHALVRDTLYSELPLARRLSLHRSVAESLEASGSTDALPLFELAHHYYLAAPAGFADRAAQYVRKAAAQAEHVLAFDTAASLRDRAVALSESAHASTSARWELLIEAGHAWFSAGGLERAIDRYRSAAELARGQQSAESLAIAALLCVRVRRGTTLYHPWLPSLLAEALELQPPGDGALKALLLSFRGATESTIDDVPARDASTREAVEMSRRLGNDVALLRTLTMRCWLMTGALAPSQTLEAASEAVSVARRAGNHEGLLDALYFRMYGHLVLGEATLADRDLSEYCALAERQHHVVHGYEAQWCHATRCAWKADFATAARLADAALARGKRIQDPLAESRYALQRRFADILQGRDVDVRGLLDTLLPYTGVPEGRALEVHVGISAGDHERARRVYEQLARNDFDLSPSPHRLVALAVLADSCARFDDRARAQCLYERLLPYAELHVFPLGTWIYLGPVAECLGQLANCLGDRALAVTHFERAVALCDTLDAQPHLARVRYQYAHTLQTIPGASPVLVRELLKQVAVAAEELGTARRFPLPLHAQHDHTDEM